MKEKEGSWRGTSLPLAPAHPPESGFPKQKDTRGHTSVSQLLCIPYTTRNASGIFIQQAHKVGSNEESRGGFFL